MNVQRTRILRSVLTLACASFLFITDARASDEPADDRTGHGMPLATARTGYYHFAGLTNPLPGTFEEDLEAAMIFTEVDGRIPIPFANDKIVLIPGVFFEHTHFEYRGWDFDVTPADQQLADFYATGFEFGVINELSSTVWLYSQLSWGLYSDLEEIDENDARFYGLVMADWLAAEGLVLGIGLSYDSDFGLPLPLPFLHFAYQTDWFRTDLTIPSDGEAFFLPHERLELGARARLIGNQYRMTYERDGWNNLRVQISTLELGAVAAVRIFGGVWFEASGGGNIANGYKAVLLDGTTLREIGLSPTWFVSGAVTYRL